MTAFAAGGWRAIMRRPRLKRGRSPAPQCRDVSQVATTICRRACGKSNSDPMSSSIDGQVTDLVVRDVAPADAGAIVRILNPIIEARVHTAFDAPFTSEAERD